MEDFRAAKIVWFTLLIVVIGALVLHFLILGEFDKLRDYLFFPLMSFSAACVVMLILLFRIRVLSSLHPLKLVGLFAIITAIDYVIIKYSVYVIGYFMFLLIYLHGFAFLVGLIYYGKRIKDATVNGN